MAIFLLLRWLLFVVEIWMAGPILYLCIVSVSAILSTKKRKAEYGRHSSASVFSNFSFAILVPAHDEEVIISTLLDSLALLAYPKERYRIYVVADNCTDRTAELACAYAGVHVYERFDQTRRGKGYALQWLLLKLEEDQLIYDAYVILDADSVVVPTFLQSMARELASGAQALQASNSVLNTTASPATALRWLALSLMNHVRPLGRNGLGASSTLTGNGMCLRRTLLQRCPWQAFSLGEDYQYYLTLIESGERVRYVPDAVVRSHMPTRFDQMRTQDIRWEASSGNQAAWRSAPKLLSAGLRFHDFVRIEAALEVLVPPLSSLVSGCLLLLIVSLLLWSSVDLIFILLLIAGLLFYIGTAFYLLHPPLRVYRAFVYAPGFMIWKLWVYFVLRRSARYTSEWIRTDRTLS